MIGWSGYKWFWNETNWKGNQVWQEIVNKLTECTWDTEATEDEKDDQLEVFYVMRAMCLYWIVWLTLSRWRDFRIGDMPWSWWVSVTTQAAAYQLHKKLSFWGIESKKTVELPTYYSSSIALSTPVMSTRTKSQGQDQGQGHDSRGQSLCTNIQIIYRLHLKDQLSVCCCSVTLSDFCM